MQTASECLVCFMRQALSTVRRSTASQQLQWQIAGEIGGMLSGFSPQLPPPENAVRYYRLIAQRTGVPDPFAGEKKESNAFALALEMRSRELIRNADDPLLAAMLFAINANVLDYGAQYRLDRDAVLASCQQHAPVINHYQALRQQIATRPRILYLLDNCGEIVFDKLLIERLLGMGCTVTAAVRQRPIINDATLEDAVSIGLDRVCPVIGNGADVPGTPLASCSVDFQRQFRQAECIISKGMGNFECLSEVQAPLFFLFIVKCTPVRTYLHDLFPASASGLQIGSPVLLRGGERKSVLG